MSENNDLFFFPEQNSSPSSSFLSLSPSLSPGPFQSSSSDSSNMFFPSSSFIEVDQDYQFPNSTCEEQQNFISSSSLSTSTSTTSSISPSSTPYSFQPSLFPAISVPFTPISASTSMAASTSTTAPASTTAPTSTAASSSSSMLPFLSSSIFISSSPSSYPFFQPSFFPSIFIPSVFVPSISSTSSFPSFGFACHPSSSVSLFKPITPISACGHKIKKTPKTKSPKSKVAKEEEYLRYNGLKMCGSRECSLFVGLDRPEKTIYCSTSCMNREHNIMGGKVKQDADLVRAKRTEIMRMKSDPRGYHIVDCREIKREAEMVKKEAEKEERVKLRQKKMIPVVKKKNGNKKS